MTEVNQVLSAEDLDYIISLPDVISARSKLDDLSDSSVVYFKIGVTDSLRSAIVTRLGLDFSNITEIPMRWIKGDTTPHIDKGKSEFNNTYLVYLNDSPGQLVLDNARFSIKKNTGFIFNEGILHETLDTGSVPRLLLGPMNELAEPVGFPTQPPNAIYYFSSEADALAAAIPLPNYDERPILASSIGSSVIYEVGHRDAFFSGAMGLSVDSSGIVYVADTYNHRIRKVTPSGVVSTLAGSVGGNSDGIGTNANFYRPYDITMDANGVMYIADTYSQRIRKLVISTGEVTTIAGSDIGFADGTGAAANFYLPTGVALDSSGNIYVTDSYNYRIRKVVISTGEVTTIAGNGNQGFDDGEAINTATFTYPGAIAVDSSDNIFVSESNNTMIRKISNGTVSSLGVDMFYDPGGIAVDSSGNIFVCNAGTSQIYKMNSDTGVVTTIAGNGSAGNVNGPGASASFFCPFGIDVDPSGNLYVCDVMNQIIRKIAAPSGGWDAWDGGTNPAIVTTLAGPPNPVLGYKDNNISLPATHWRIASNSTGSSIQTYIWDNGQTLNSEGVYLLYPSLSGSVCFLEGTTVLCLVNGIETYIPVEQLTKGSLVKTSLNGYKKLDLIAKEVMNNPGTDERIQNRLYKCTPAKYPELTSDLYITGCHSILVDTITDKQRAELIIQLTRIFVTDKKYRLIACVDERAEPWNSEGKYTVWHFALENENDRMNYGVYVNGGLLVESCSKHGLKNKSDMVFQ